MEQNQAPGGMVNNQPAQYGGEQLAKNNGNGSKSRTGIIIAVVVVVVAGIALAVMNRGASPASNSNEPANTNEAVTNENVNTNVNEPPAVVPPKNTNQNPGANANVNTNSNMAVQPDCVVMGCNNEICSSPDDQKFTACVYLPEYSCYSTAKCEKQVNGSCGWTQTAELTQCLAQAR